MVPPITDDEQFEAAAKRWAEAQDYYTRPYQQGLWGAARKLSHRAFHKLRPDEPTPGWESVDLTVAEVRSWLDDKPPVSLSDVDRTILRGTLGWEPSG